MRARSVGKGRWRMLAAVTAVVALMQAALQVATATPAAAVPGLEQTAVLSESSSSHRKSMIARCPAGKRVIGGGGSVLGPANTVMLTALEPVHDTVKGDGFQSIAYEMEPGIEGPWSLLAFAICADPLPGLEIVSSFTGVSSSRFKHVAAACPGNKRVLDTGARVYYGNGQVGLQLTRPDRNLTFARATAREDATGYSSSWVLGSMAICADPVGAIYADDVRFGVRAAVAECPWPMRVHGAGGGGSIRDVTGPIFLERIQPTKNKRRVSVGMTATPPSVSGMVATAVCAP